MDVYLLMAAQMMKQHWHGRAGSFEDRRFRAEEPVNRTILRLAVAFVLIGVVLTSLSWATYALPAISASTVMRT